MSEQSKTPRCVWRATAQLGEGPLWSEREQALYWTDILNRRLLRLTPETGEQRIWHFNEYIGAVAERSAGGLIVTLKTGFAFFDPKTEALTPLHDPEPGVDGNRFNDGKIDVLGRFWAGTMDYDCEAPTGSLYRFDPDQRCTKIEEGFAVTNGPAWSTDGRTMYHNATAIGKVYAYNFDPKTGDISNKRLFLHVDPADGYPDGMTPDAQGGLWIAHFGGAKVVRYLPDGQVERIVRLPTTNITSCAFGGADLKTLYITSAIDKLSPELRKREILAGGLFACEPEGLHGIPSSYFAG